MNQRSLGHRHSRMCAHVHNSHGTWSHTGHTRCLDWCSYSINPPLPAGLSMDSKTGIIQGTCNTVTKSSAHTVTVSNVKGHASTTVTIAVAAGV